MLPLRVLCSNARFATLVARSDLQIDFSWPVAALGTPRSRERLCERWEIDTGPLMRLPLFIALFFAAISNLSAEVLQVTWRTTHAAPVAVLQPPASTYLPAFRLAIQNLPEAAIVALALSQPSILGLTEEQAAVLRPLTAQRYALMAQSPQYATARSALPYCFSAERPATGLASIYVPAGAKTSTPVILFLHGYGGSFLWYQHYLSELFPDHIIICPAYGITTETIPRAYVMESISAVSQRLGFQVSKPVLVGLSAGGFGACRLYTEAPHFYWEMICLAAYPPDDTLSRFDPESRPRFLTGDQEPFVTSGDFRQRTERIRRTCPTSEAFLIPDAGHFFLLTHPKETEKFLRRWFVRWQ